MEGLCSRLPEFEKLLDDMKIGIMSSGRYLGILGLVTTNTKEVRLFQYDALEISAMT